ncbi:kinase-like domain, phloem protein 2-like protein [Tanacetum coccineum]
MLRPRTPGSNKGPTRKSNPNATAELRCEKVARGQFAGAIGAELRLKRWQAGPRKGFRSSSEIKTAHYWVGEFEEWFDGDQQFWTEVSLLSSLKHKNLVSLVGFCDDNDEKVIIYKNETRASLSNYLSDSMLLTWVRRLEISIGIAQALSYIHYDESRDFSIIHRNIDSGSVYLNDDWEPKLGDFIGSMKIKASERHLYCPKLIKSITVGYGSLQTRANREKKLHEIIDWDLWKQMDTESFNIFAETAYDCLNEERSQRPNIDEIVPKLEKALKLACENRPVRPLFFSLPSFYHNLCEYLVNCKT